MDNLRDPRLSSSYWALRVTFIAVPILAGLDKFTNLLTYWPNYLSPAFAKLLPMSPSGFMQTIGIVEMFVGLIVLSRATRIGAYVAMGGSRASRSTSRACTFSTSQFATSASRSVRSRSRVSMR